MRQVSAPGTVFGACAEYAYPFAAEGLGLEAEGTGGGRLAVGTGGGPDELGLPEAMGGGPSGLGFRTIGGGFSSPPGGSGTMNLFLGFSSSPVSSGFLLGVGRGAVVIGGRADVGRGGGFFFGSLPADVAECPVVEGEMAGAAGGSRRFAGVGLVTLAWLACRRGNGGASLRGGSEGAGCAPLLRRCGSVGRTAGAGVSSSVAAMDGERRGGGGGIDRDDGFEVGAATSTSFASSSESA